MNNYVNIEAGVNIDADIYVQKFLGFGYGYWVWVYMF